MSQEYTQSEQTNGGSLSAPRKKNTVKIFLLFSLLIFSVIIGFGTYAAAKLKRPFSDDGQIQMITIAKGSNTRQVAGQLENEKIISGGNIFLYYVYIKGAQNKIQAGTYELSASMTIPAIVETLTQGKVVSNEIRLRVGEGWNLTVIAQGVEQSGLGTSEQFYALAGFPPSLGARAASPAITKNYDFLENLPAGASLEGYLFPDTYFVSREGAVDELVSKMLTNFDNKVGDELRLKAQMQNRTLHSVITMASLIEGEVGRTVSGRGLTSQELEEIDQERRVVADIFWTRLSLGMGLESDASISYATGKPRRQATLADLEVKSPYNTYRNSGLPPGPINNPSLAAIDAALNPADTPYLFFLSAPDGKAYFGRTLEEHRQNRIKYLPAN